MSLLRIIAEKSLREWSQKHARANSSLKNWTHVVKHSNWRSFMDIRRTFPSADRVTVSSGRTVVIFNIAGNHYRLICAVHFESHLVYAMRFLTHAEYDKSEWRNEL